MTIGHIYQDVTGWFDWLDTYRRWVAETPEDGTIVEVGCFKGRSLSFLAVEVANTGKRISLWGVDTWQGSPELMTLPDVVDGSFYDQFVAQMVRLPIGVRPNWIQENSRLAAAQFEDGSVDRVWIDGDHSHAGLTADLEAWWPKVRPGGEMGGHDYGCFGVTRAVHEWASRQGRPLGILEPCPEAGLQNVAKSWIVRKPAPVTSWEVPKDERSVLMCPVSNHPFVPTQTVASLGALMLHAREHAAAEGFTVEWHWESDAFTLDAMRDQALYRGLCDGFSHVLFLDADNVWPHNLLRTMLPHHGMGVVGGLYHGKAAPHEPVAMVKAADDPNPNMYRRLPHVHEEEWPVQVDLLGMGCTLVPLAAVAQMPRPWFAFQRNVSGYTKVTEDIWFCQGLARIGCPLFVLPFLHVGHVAHTVVGVRQYEPHVAMVEAAHRARARTRQRAAITAAMREGVA